MGTTYAQWQTGIAIGFNRFGRTVSFGPFNQIRAIGIGNFPNNNPPAAAFHINTNLLTPVNNIYPNFFLRGEVFRTDAPNVTTSWRMLRNGIERFNINSFFAGNTVRMGTVQNEALEFFTNDTKRMFLDANNNFLGIGPAFSNAFPPRSFLHLGIHVIGGGGFRNWMTQGTFIQVENDNMYVGLREFAPDIHDAIINWGNNPAGGSPADRLRFVFTAAIGLGLPASGVNGIETARMISDGTITGAIGTRFGIGGDAAFGNPYTAGVDPGNTVEINSPAATPTPGNSGLRFTDLNTNSTPQPNQFDPPAVLSVDTSGNVILVPDRGDTAAADADWFEVGSSDPPTDINNDIYTQGNVLIGNGLTQQPVGRLHVFATPTSLPLRFERDFGGNQVNALDVIISSNPNGGGSGNVIDAASVTFRLLNPNGRGDMAFMTNPQNIRMIIKNNGNVGIGDFKGSLVPTERLDVDGNARFRQVPNDGPNDVLVTGFLNSTTLTEDDITLRTLAFTGDTNDVLVGNGTWKPVAADADWFDVTTNQPPTSIDSSIYTFGNVGVNTSTPGNHLEINSNDLSPVPGSSGLRFTDLNTNSTPVPNQFSPPAVLSVDTSGNVILVPDSGGVGGADNDWEITSSGNDVFTGVQGISIPNLPQGNVGIGLQPGVDAKLDVLQVDNLIGVNVLNNSPSLKFNRNTGTFSAATGSVDLNIGVHGFASGPGVGKNIGVLGEIPPGTGNAGEFIGDVLVLGTITANACNCPSDERYKNNIVTIDSDSAMNMVKQLRGVYFEWDTAAFPEKNFTAGRKIGLIAQEVDSIIPEVVMTDRSGFFGLDYDRILPVVVEAMKEMALRVDTLEAALAQCGCNALITICHNGNTITVTPSALQVHLNHGDVLGACTNINKMGGSSQNNSTGTDIDDNMKRGMTGAALFQNTPNPFNQNTSIRYFLPEKANNASIIIYDLQGRQIKQFNSLQKGKNSITLNGGELYAGMFKYVLIVDGELIGSKTMVLTD